jgi:hypothetical protein
VVLLLYVTSKLGIQANLPENCDNISLLYLPNPYPVFIPFEFWKKVEKFILVGKIGIGQLPKIRYYSIKLVFWFSY